MKFLLSYLGLVASFSPMAATCSQMRELAEARGNVPMNSLLLANRIVGQSWLPHAIRQKAFDYDTAAIARTSAEHNAAMFESLGLECPQSVLVAVKQAMSRETAARHAFIAEINSARIKDKAERNVQQLT